MMVMVMVTAMVLMVVMIMMMMIMVMSHISLCTLKSSRWSQKQAMPDGIKTSPEKYMHRSKYPRSRGRGTEGGGTPSRIIAKKQNDTRPGLLQLSVYI